MPTKVFDIKDSIGVKHLLDDGMRKAALRAVHAAAIHVVADIQGVVIPTEPRPPVDVGAYCAAWRARSTPNGAEIENTMPYAGIIEDGARPENIKVGRKMIDALAAWVLRKGIAANAADARGVAWAIAMSMKKRGIFNGGKGLKILAKGMRNVSKYISDEFKNEVRRAF